MDIINCHCCGREKNINLTFALNIKYFNYFNLTTIYIVRMPV